MEQMEKKQFEAGHNGLSQRRSYPNIVDHSTNNQLQSTAMSRQDSKSSILSGTTVSSSQQSGSSTPSAGDQASHRPKNFGTVVGGIYRSSYPQEADYPFLTKLGLKTIITLVDKDMPETFVPFMKASNIQHRQIVMAGTKKETIPIEVMASILEVILDKHNQPVLIHCNQGKHRTGCVVAITRILQHWNVDRVVDEYKAYAHPKIREEDVAYIHKFRLDDLARFEPLRDIVASAALAAYAINRPPYLLYPVDSTYSTDVVVVAPQPSLLNATFPRFWVATAMLFAMLYSLVRLCAETGQHTGSF